MTRFLPVLVGIDALLLLIMVILAASPSPQDDAAGRGMAWFFPVMLGGWLGVTLLVWLVGFPRVATVLAIPPALLPVGMLAQLVIGPLIGDRVRNGALTFTEPKSRALARAISRGNEPRIRRLVAGGASPNAVGSDGETMLTFTVRWWAARVPLLLQLGADPNFRAPPDGYLPLEEALAGAEADAAVALVTAGADVNAIGKLGDPVLFSSIRTVDRRSFRYLVEHGARVDVVDHNGWTLLMYGIRYARFADCLLALDRGADPSHVAPDSQSVETLLAQAYTPGWSADSEYQELARRLAARGLTLPAPVSAAP